MCRKFSKKSAKKILKILSHKSDNKIKFKVVGLENSIRSKFNLFKINNFIKLKLLIESICLFSALYNIIYIVLYIFRHSRRTQPAYFMQMIVDYFEATKDQKFLAEILPHADRELNFWQNNRTVEVADNEQKKHTLFQFRVGPIFMLKDSIR